MLTNSPLAHEFVFLVEWKDAEGMQRTHELGSDAHTEATDILGGSLEWPYELAPGRTAEDPVTLA
jgi:hypothetical protein